MTGKEKRQRDKARRNYATEAESPTAWPRVASNDVFVSCHTPPSPVPHPQKDTRLWYQRGSRL